MIGLWTAKLDVFSISHYIAFESAPPRQIVASVRLWFPFLFCSEVAMELEQLRNFLLGCTIINVALLLLWWMMFACVHDWIYRVHSRWFKLSTESFDTAHYKLMGQWKLMVFMFNLIPYVALSIIA